MSNVETFRYDNRIVRDFACATVLWGVVGMFAIRANVPTIAFVLFIVVFVGTTLWALSIRRTHVDRMCRLPLQDDRLEPEEGEPRA